MTDHVVDTNEVRLNSVRYPIIGGLKQQLISGFAEKTVTGDYDLDSDPMKSHWVIVGDGRGGLLVEEMDEKVDADRFWWSTCDADYKNNLFLPRLANTITKPDKTVTPTIVNTNMELETGWDYSDADISRTDAQKNAGTYSLEIKCEISETNITGQYLVDWTPGNQYTFSCYVKCENATYMDAKIGIDDGVTTTYSSLHETTSWAQLTVQKTLSTAAKYMRLVLWGISNGGAEYSAWFDTATLTLDSSATGISYAALTPNLMVEFNGTLYVALGDVLTKLNSAGTTLQTILQPVDGTNIAQLIPSLNSCLYIYMGDTKYYWYLSTTDVPAITDVTDATYGVQWDSKLWKMDADGNWWYATTPNAAAPTWTSRASLTDIADQVETLFIGGDASGDNVIYAATNSILKVYDFTNNLWLDTYVKLPNHPSGGKGATYWNDGIYLSSGLGVKKYDVANLTLGDVGLDTRDGIPTDYDGEIVKLLGETSSRDMFALIGSAPPNLLTNSSFETGDPPDDWTLVGAGATVSRSSAQAKVGTYSALVTRNGTNCYIRQNLTTYANYLNKTVTLGAWVYATVANRVRLRLLDQVGAYSSYHSGVAGWEWLTVTLTVDPNSTYLYSNLTINTGDTAAYFDGVVLAETSSLPESASGLYAYNGKAWRCFWTDTVNNSAMYDAVVSSSPAYRVYWGAGADLYYTDLSRGITNPRHISGQPFATSSMHISSWFDGNWQAGNKVAVAVRVATLGDTSADEDVVVKYRTNHANTDRDTGWTTLGTIESNTVTTYTFQSEAGESFRDIQFRFDLARAAGSTTETPIVVYAVLDYYKVPAKKWGWAFTADCTKSYGDKSPEQLLDAIETAADTETLLTFMFEDTTKYVKVVSVEGTRLTGEGRKGQYQIFVAEI